MESFEKLNKCETPDIPVITADKFAQYIADGKPVINYYNKLLVATARHFESIMYICKSQHIGINLIQMFKMEETDYVYFYIY